MISREQMLRPVEIDFKKPIIRLSAPVEPVIMAKAFKPAEAAKTASKLDFDLPF